MIRNVLILAGWLATTSAAYPQIAVKDIEARYGQHGPTRFKLEYQRREQVCFRFLITGAKTDAAGLMDVQIAVQLLDPTGATAAQGIKQRRDPLTFGSSFPEVVTFELPFNAVPGVYQLKCTITDNYTHQTTAFERNLQLLPPSFAITSPEFHYDSDRRLDAPFGGLVNQRLYFRCNIQGFRCDDGKAELDSRIQVLDAKTRQPILPSLRTFHHTSNPLLPTDVFALTGEFALHQAGDFLLQISATDRRSGKETCIEVPLRVQSCWPADAPRVVNQLPQP